MTLIDNSRKDSLARTILRWIAAIGFIAAGANPACPTDDRANHKVCDYQFPDDRLVDSAHHRAGIDPIESPDLQVFY